MAVASISERAIDLLPTVRAAAPVLGISVFQPNERSTNIWRTVLGVVNGDRLFAASRHEDLDSFIVIAEAALVQRALDANASLDLRRGLPPDRLPWLKHAEIASKLFDIFAKVGPRTQMRNSPAAQMRNNLAENWSCYPSSLASGVAR